VLDGGLAALDCRLDRLIEAGDHVLALLEVSEVLASRPGPALLRLRGRYVDESGRAAGRG
jgi:flavin reductase (DIM6/NTAB) family NADH-FMN oxidoreductase RutF